MKLINLNESIITRTAVLLTICLVTAVPTFGDYEISWSTIDGGGGRSSGGTYTLTGTIGQPDADWSSGGSYELLGGFWPGGPLCFVDFRHFARFAEYWLDAPCNVGNDWCSGADLDQLGDVDGTDLGLFVDEWLYWCPYNWPLK